MGKGTRSNMKVLVNKPENPKSHKIYAFLVLVLGIAIIALAFIVLFHVQKIEITEMNTAPEQRLQIGCRMMIFRRIRYMY